MIDAQTEGVKVTGAPASPGPSPFMMDFNGTGIMGAV
jgi:hypothetical protein